MLRILRGLSAPLTLLVIVLLLCVLNTSDKVIQGHPTRYQVLLIVDIAALALFLGSFSRGVGLLAGAARARSKGLTAGVLLLCPLSLFVGYHLLAPNWLAKSFYKFLVALHFAYGPALTPAL